MTHNVCGDNRFELIAKYKRKLIESTNISSDKAEMAVIDNILFRFWQLGWLDKLENHEKLIADARHEGYCAGYDEKEREQYDAEYNPLP